MKRSRFHWWILTAAVLLATLPAGSCDIDEFKSSMEQYLANRDLIVFTSDRDGLERTIYTMRPDGSEIFQVTSGLVDCKHPDWGPGKSRIVYSRDNGSYWEINLISWDGTGNRTLTSGHNDIWPEWSPASPDILFSRYGSTDSIYRTDAEGTTASAVLDSSQDTSVPDWHPDGTTFVLMLQNHDAGNYEINEAWAGGSIKAVLTSAAGQSQNPVWSPDGTQIVFHSNRDGDDEIFIMDADGGNQTQLTSNTTFSDRHPDWSPDGTRIVFSSNRYGDYDIYVMDTDGSNVLQITDDDGSDSNPVWQ